MKDIVAIVGVLNLVVITITAYLIYRQNKASQEWNRRHTAHDLIFEASLGRFRSLRDRLEQKIDIYDPGQTYTTVKDKLDAEDHIFLDAALNFFENVCLAIKDNVLDEDILYESFGGILCAYTRWASPYIHAQRSISPTLWIEFDPFIERWATRDKQAVARLVEPGKSKL